MVNTAMKEISFIIAYKLLQVLMEKIEETLWIVCFILQ